MRSAWHLGTLGRHIHTICLLFSLSRNVAHMRKIEIPHAIFMLIAEICCLSCQCPVPNALQTRAMMMIVSLRRHFHNEIFFKLKNSELKEKQERTKKIEVGHDRGCLTQETLSHD